MSSTATPLSRILLVGERSPSPEGDVRPAIRRYRLARLRLNTTASSADRFAHLRRSYD